MTSFHPHKTLFLLILVLVSVPVLSQTKVRISADRTQILIGEPIKLTLEADIPENEAIGFFNPDSIPHFEILRRDVIDTVNTSKGTVLNGAIFITSFDSGHWVIPPILLRDSVYTDSIAVDVGYTPFDVSKPYNDIKDVIDADAEKKESKTQWWYFAVAAAVLAIIFFFVFRKRKKPLAAVVTEEDPYKKAMRELTELQGRHLPKDLLYAELVNIFRIYVLKRKGIESLHQTTGDLVDRLRTLGMPARAFDELGSALRFSDLVKFARFDASGEDDDKTRQTIKASIQLLEEMRPPPDAVAATPVIKRT